MSRRTPKSKKNTVTPTRSINVEPPKMTLFDVPDEDEEDADRKALKEITQRAAVVLQQCWQKRPKWTQPHALLKMVEAIDSRPKSAQEVSKDERKRLSDLGLIIPASLSYGETPIPEFLAILKRVSTIREDANGGVAEGSIIGRLEGVFYDVGCGIGTLCFAAAIRHNFSHVVGIEILQGLFDVASDLERHFNLSVKPRMFARIDKVPTKLRFVIGDACAVKWLQIPPSVCALSVCMTLYCSVCCVSISSEPCHPGGLLSLLSLRCGVDDEVGCQTLSASMRRLDCDHHSPCTCLHNTKWERNYYFRGD
mmetsp:Transcript_14145/g.18376  ORF Transcript_14145/g.18376 Transcript_14145/m.18376 type:complete len:309 (-) Transcript_14145:255-1181(-)